MTAANAADRAVAVSGAGRSRTFSVEHAYPTRYSTPVVAETDDWVEAQRLVIESHHGYAHREPDLVVRGTHPSHTWERREGYSDRRCASCDGWDNGSYGSQAPCGYDWRGRSLVTAIADELVARGRAEPWLYLDKAVADDRMSVSDADAVRAFQRFLQEAPRRPDPKRPYTRAEALQLREAYVNLGGHDDVVAHLDRLLAPLPADNLTQVSDTSTEAQSQDDAAGSPPA